MPAQSPMKKNLRLPKSVFFYVMLAILFSLTTWAITPNEVFEDGRRAFTLGHYRDAYAHFSEFEKTWPAHPLNDRALWYLTLAEIRMEADDKRDDAAARLASFTTRVRRLRDKLPTADLDELTASIELLRAGEGSGVLASRSAVLNLSPDVLGHLLIRGWLPVPENAPLQILGWAAAWEQRHAASEPLVLKARIQLMRAKALWRVGISPLARDTSVDLLKSWGVWPVSGAMLKALHAAFNDGDPDIKREAALLGLSVETVGSLEKPVKLGSSWLRYLRERGIYDREAWCPR
ncbi:MAG: hypothetical protein HQM09_22105 [Candidatus Riflebacteria bacterium]|nr:hypothetical protein [Candidatus Riflebacteria bacterium]